MITLNDKQEHKLKTEMYTYKDTHTKVILKTRNLKCAISYWPYSL